MEKENSLNSERTEKLKELKSRWQAARYTHNPEEIRAIFEEATTAKVLEPLLDILLKEGFESHETL